MEPEGSLPCSQEPSTGLYPKPDESSPYYLSNFHLIVFIHLLFNMPSVFYFCLSHQYPYIHPLLSPFVLHALPISCCLTWSLYYTWRSVRFMKLLIMQFSPASRRFISLRYLIYISIIYFKILQRDVDSSLKDNVNGGSCDRIHSAYNWHFSRFSFSDILVPFNGF
jgi:hypothetical protein